MAQSSTIYVFTVRLADADRGVYETLNLRLAQHPSESPEYLVTRLLAYCLEYVEGIAFSKGLSDTDEPAITVRDLTGALQAWIEIGAPEAARLHKASKSARRVAVYPHRDTAPWLARLAGERIHRASLILRSQSTRCTCRWARRRCRVPWRCGAWKIECRASVAYRERRHLRILELDLEHAGKRRSDLAHVDLAHRMAGRDTRANHEKCRAHFRSLRQIAVRAQI
jgi:uncharacterized protein YaeQ